MNHVRQTCPMCGWARAVEVPSTANLAHDETVAKHVARSLQWEWQVHMKDVHAPLAAAYECLTPGAFDDWVAQEGQTPTVQETPPSEGVGQTVGVNLPTITPEQAKQLAEAVERTMVSVADSVQRFAEHLVPTIHSAQEQLVNGLRAIVEQRPGRTATCSCGGVVNHCPGDAGCLLRPIPADQVNLTRRFWENLYGPVPIADPNRTDGSQYPPLRIHVQRDLADGVPGDRPYGTVDAELCSNCQRLAGEPHGLPSCAELS